MHKISLKGNTLLRRDDSDTRQNLPKESSSGLSLEVCPLYNLHPGWENGRMSVVMGLRSRKEKKAEMVFCFKYSSSWYVGSVFHLVFAEIFHKRNLINPQNYLWRKRNLSTWCPALVTRSSLDKWVLRNAWLKRGWTQDKRQRGVSGSLLSSSAQPGLLDKHTCALGSCLSSSLSGSHQGTCKGSSSEQNDQACCDKVSRNLLWGFVFCVFKDQLCIPYPNDL